MRYHKDFQTARAESYALTMQKQVDRIDEERRMIIDSNNYEPEDDDIVILRTCLVLIHELTHLFKVFGMKIPEKTMFISMDSVIEGGRYVERRYFGGELNLEKPNAIGIRTRLYGPHVYYLDAATIANIKEKHDLHILRSFINQKVKEQEKSVYKRNE
ncbi:unnamed protein product [Didymodactylos carnosus]|uniref:Uncharacterized protein n=1 Tax=Didymodactylos carnosus TaxID=1234261 RepID=A0A8S2F1E6_9BILA|nr:unnamed protein product [Didymodactylos carnosus]CAF4179527.1 unnamed protein product [Didymodactylos carnosus]